MANDSPIQFKGTTLKIIQTQLRTADATQLHTALSNLTGNVPDFFEGELAVLDFSQTKLQDIAVDWPSIITLLRQSGLNPVATCGLPADLAMHAVSAGLPTVSSDDFGKKSLKTPTPQPIAEAAEVTPTEAAPTASPPDRLPEVPPATTTILDKPLRSGQRFYARGGDLIITAMVSAGAEVIADGSIHVYAPLRGRALAGASGNQAARIFTTCMEAELVSIAGIYRTFDGDLPQDQVQQPAVIRLLEDGPNQHLQIAPLALR